MNRYKKPLLQLKIPKSKSISDRGIDYLMSECDVIEELDISWAKAVTDIGLRTIAITLGENLKELNISHVNNLRGEGLASLGNLCRNLISLKMAHTEKIATWAVAKLAYGCTNIQELNFAYCRQINDQTLKIISENHLR